MFMKGDPDRRKIEELGVTELYFKNILLDCLPCEQKSVIQRLFPREIFDIKCV